MQPSLHRVPRDLATVHFVCWTGKTKSFKTKLLRRHWKRKTFQIFSQIFNVNNSADNSRLHSNRGESEWQMEGWEMWNRVHCSIFMFFKETDTFGLCPILTVLYIVKKLSPLDRTHSDPCKSKTAWLSGHVFSDQFVEDLLLKWDDRQMPASCTSKFEERRECNAFSRYSCQAEAKGLD